jgi:hypothetical protein
MVPCYLALKSVVRDRDLHAIAEQLVRVVDGGVQRVGANS